MYITQSKFQISLKCQKRANHVKGMNGYIRIKLSQLIVFNQQFSIYLDRLFMQLAFCLKLRHNRMSRILE